MVQSSSKPDSQFPPKERDVKETRCEESVDNTDTWKQGKDHGTEV